MYICKSCGKEFEEPKRITEKYVEDLPDTFSYTVCPYCNDEDYEELVECKLCGDLKLSSDCEDEVCEKCYWDLVKKFDRVLSSEFTEEEIEVLKIKEINR